MHSSFVYLNNREAINCLVACMLSRLHFMFYVLWMYRNQRTRPGYWCEGSLAVWKALWRYIRTAPWANSLLARSVIVFVWSRMQVIHLCTKPLYRQTQACPRQCRPRAVSDPKLSMWICGRKCKLSCPVSPAPYWTGEILLLFKVSRPLVVRS